MQTVVPVTVTFLAFLGAAAVTPAGLPVPFVATVVAVVLGLGSGAIFQLTVGRGVETARLNPPDVRVWIPAFIVGALSLFVGELSPVSSLSPWAPIALALYITFLVQALADAFLTPDPSDPTERGR